MSSSNSSTAGANVMVKRKDGATVLHCAASNGHDECVKTILAAGGDVKAVDNNKRTPLILAAWHGHDNVVELLLDANAELWAKDNQTMDSGRLCQLTGRTTALSISCSAPTT